MSILQYGYTQEIAAFLCMEKCLFIEPFHLDNLHSNDMELRLMLKRVWPNITKKTLDKVIPKRPQGIKSEDLTFMLQWQILKIL